MPASQTDGSLLGSGIRAGYFVLTDIQLEGMDLDYCSTVGTLDFDGMGSYSFTTTSRCSYTGMRVDTGIESYAVNPDGSLLFIEPERPDDPTHGQILNHGRTSLIDGTARTDPDKLLFTGIAQKL